MCYRPIRILNPSRKYRSDLPKYLYVPCGHCADCQRNKHNEWFFRCMVEYNRVRSVGGAVYFLTLTYNNENLPYFILPDGSVIKGFSKRHIHNFIKYFRILLKKRHLNHLGIKYLVCSEYGSHTQRPHYHALLFVDYHIPLNVLLDILRRSWHYGFVVIAKQGLEVVSPSGVRYASKYICKDMSFETCNKKLQNYLDCDFATRKERLKPYKEFLPNHYQSVGFGESWLIDLEKRQDLAEYLANNRVELELGKHDVFKIPRYYHLKTEKQIDKYLSLVLDKVVQEPTELGKEVARIKLSNRIPSDMALLRGYTSDYLNIAVPTYDNFKIKLDELRKRYPLAKEFYRYGSFDNETDFLSCRTEFINVVSNIQQEVDLYKLSVYRCFLRHYPIFDDENPDHKFSEIGDIISRMICSDNIQPEYAKILPFDDKDRLVATPLKDDLVTRRVKTCSDHPFFEPYETVCRFIDWLDAVSSINREFTYLQKKEKKERTKRLCPNTPTIYNSY